jgi:iron(III) transport system ATP-binding protein
MQVEAEEQMTAYLSVERVYKRFNDTPVLEDINLGVKKG